MMLRNRAKGVTLIELVIVMVIVGILASAFSSVVIPMINFYFYYPQSSRVNNTAADVLQIIIEGDEKSDGLRFTSPPCNLPSGGSSTIKAATASSLTYNYSKRDECGTGGTASHSVTIAYDSANHIVTRAIDGGAATAIPYYATSTSGIKLDPPASNFFRYYNSAGTEIFAPFSGAQLLTIYRVDITVIALSGVGEAKYGGGQIMLKAGVEIRRFP